MTTGLIVVAHPDDDALFAGPFQIAHPWVRWTVVCATYQAGDPRAVELAGWQRSLGAEQVIHLGFVDDFNDFRTGVSSFTADDVAAALAAVDIQPDVVLTHNHIGEYGHCHHRVVHAAVKRVYREGAYMFAHYLDQPGIAPGIEPVIRPDIEIRVPCFVERAMAHYDSQKRLIRQLHDKLACCEVGVYSKLV